jgi:hypothetical protein
LTRQIYRIAALCDDTLQTELLNLFEQGFEVGVEDSLGESSHSAQMRPAAAVDVR